MQTCLIWVLAFIAVWGGILGMHVLAGESAVLANGLFYGVLGAVAMGVMGRCASGWHPAFRRMSGLLGCAILAGVDVGIAGIRGEPGQKLFFAALLGIALAVLFARHAPTGVRRRWLGGKSDS